MHADFIKIINWYGLCIATQAPTTSTTSKDILCVHFCVCNDCMVDVDYGTHTVVYEDLQHLR